MTTTKTTTPKTTTKKETMNTTTTTEWALVNANYNGDEYSIKYKGYVFLMIEESERYSNRKHINLYVIKDFEKKHMTRIFSFEYINQNRYPEGKAIFENIKINYSNSGFADTPWKEIGKKANAYIDALSND